MPVARLALGQHRAGGGFDSPVIGLDDGRGRGGLALRIVEKQSDIVMQCALISLQGQRIWLALLCGDLVCKSWSSQSLRRSVRPHDRTVPRCDEAVHNPGAASTNDQL
jgi:hypothetical protein